MSTTLLQTASKTATDSLLHQNLTSSAVTGQSYNFSFAPYLRQNSLAALASEVPVCPAFLSGHCPLGRRCPDRHPTPTQQPQHHYGRGNDNFVCKHWLKGLCKKGDACDYLHEFNLRKMSECQFFNQNGYCQNGDECLYVHVKEDSKLPLCDDYNNGFCKMGPRCGKRHVRRKLCEFYLAGFCPEGNGCKYGVHLKAGTISETDNEEDKRRVARVEEMEKKDDDSKREFGWRGGRGGRGGRWKNKRERRGGN